MILSLQSLPFEDPAVSGFIGGGLVALIMGMLVIFVILFILFWIYTSFAYMAIAKKNKQSSPGLAWIPIVGPAIIAYKSSKMHWWPFILLPLTFVPILGGIASLVYSVFFIIWNWKMLEAINKPAWWSIFILIFPVYLIFLGIAAWSKD